MSVTVDVTDPSWVGGKVQGLSCARMSAKVGVSEGGRENPNCTRMSGKGQGDSDGGRGSWDGVNSECF